MVKSSSRNGQRKVYISYIAPNIDLDTRGRRYWLRTRNWGADLAQSACGTAAINMTAAVPIRSPTTAFPLYFMARPRCDECFRRSLTTELTASYVYICGKDDLSSVPCGFDQDNCKQNNANTIFTLCLRPGHLTRMYIWYVLLDYTRILNYLTHTAHVISLCILYGQG